MSSLQLGLIVAGIVLVLGVMLYNRWQEQRMRRRIEQAAATPPPRATGGDRVEPTLHTADRDAVAAIAATPAVPGTEVAHDPDWRPPLDAEIRLPEHEAAATDAAAEPAAQGPEAVAPRLRGATAAPTAAAPDPDIECIVTVQPIRPAAAGALAAALHPRLGKPVRWYGRRDPGGVWQRLGSDSRGEYGEFAACMLLADRNGPATLAQLRSFIELVATVTAQLPGAYVAPDPADEAARAEALDRLCAELDMQIGLTIRKAPATTIAGTRLRGVAEAAGFRLAPSGRFECVQEETGAVLFTLQDASGEPFTPDSLRQGATSSVVMLLDVPRVADPTRAFDQMKLAAKRMAHTVGGELVDDNQRLLNDAGLAAIRQQIATADAALRRYNIEPGSPRALKLFAA